MAENSEGASKTEEATPRKLDEARRRGDVAKSTDLAQAAGLAGTFGVLVMMGGGLGRELMSKLTPFLAHPDSISMQGGGGVEVARYAIMAAAPAMAAILGATALSGAAGNLLQTGLIFSGERLKPDLNKLSPLEGFKRIFGIDGLMQFVRSALKVLATTAVAAWVLWPHAHEFIMLPTLTPMAMLTYGVDLSKSLGLAVLILLTLIGGIDFMWQRQRHTAKLRMTKEEMKEDFRQSEGDPHIKARQRQIRAERARRRMIQSVPKATVVVMNPTHFAVALRYEAGETPAPKCVAKGMDDLALKIREVAEEHGVPVIEDPPLARALYAAVDVDETIPAEHYQAVAKIIGFIMAATKSPKRARQL